MDAQVPHMYDDLHLEIWDSFRKHNYTVDIIVFAFCIYLITLTENHIIYSLLIKSINYDLKGTYFEKKVCVVYDNHIHSLELSKPTHVIKWSLT